MLSIDPQNDRLHCVRFASSGFSRVLLKRAHGDGPQCSPVPLGQGFVVSKLPYLQTVSSLFHSKTSILISRARKQDFLLSRHEWRFRVYPGAQPRVQFGCAETPEVSNTMARHCSRPRKFL